MGGIFIFSCPHHNQSLHCVYSTILHSREEKKIQNPIWAMLLNMRLLSQASFMLMHFRVLRIDFSVTRDDSRETSKKKEKRKNRNQTIEFWVPLFHFTFDWPSYWKNDFDTFEKIPVSRTLDLWSTLLFFFISCAIFLLWPSAFIDSLNPTVI